MKAEYIVFTEKGVVAVETEEVTEGNLAPFEVLMRNEVTHVSAGTELARLNGMEQGQDFPARPGYAAIGRIVAKGASVDDFEVGQRVLYSGKHCSAQRFEHGQDHQWGRLYPVPDELASEDAAYGCLAQIAMTAPLLTGCELGDTVAVFGLGVVGNFCAQWYRHMGARVIALDPVAQRCELARQVGMDTVLDVPPDKQVEAVMELTDGKGATTTVDAAGHSAVVANCVAATALFGQVALLGSPRAVYECNMTETLRNIHQSGLVVRGAHMWHFPALDVREVKHTVASNYRTVFKMIADGALSIKPLQSHVVQPEDAQAVYDGLQHKRDEYVGVVFQWE
jgi:threonine dehydrogenase-like Zn-dependent dehydrogenase